MSRTSEKPQVDGGELQRVESFQWPSGHVGHLSAAQQSALDKFKELCKAQGYYDPGDDKTPASHDDETLLRYLRARKFVPQDGLGQFKDTEDWRGENDLDHLYETIDIQEYEQTRRLYPQWTGRRDKRGIPFYVFEVSQVEAKDLNAYQNDKDRKKGEGPDVKSKVPRKMMRLFALYENLVRFVLPLCSALPNRPNAETPVSQSSNVVDISNVGFRKFWNLRTHLQDSSRLATAHYPETLDRIFVVGAPGFFPTIWNWAKVWFDPITQQKISILSQANTFSTLSKFVDPDNIPKKYGGNLEWSFGDTPALEPAIIDSLRWKEDIRDKKGRRTLPIGPIKWQYDDGGDLVAVAIGSEQGAPRHKVIAGLHPQADVASLALSPGRNTHSALFATVSHSGAVTQRQALSRQATAASQAQLTQNGSAVQPTPMAAAAMAGSENRNSNIGATTASAIPDSSKAGTDTVPNRDNQDKTYLNYKGDESSGSVAREGTSSTRFEQQTGTHAEGTLAEGTPAVRQDGQGTEHSVMEPRTVGQAHKDTPLTREVPTEPTIIEQAQQLAEQAVETAKAVPAMALNAVGMGEKKEEGEATPSKAHDPRIDDMDSKHVEEFMRSQTMSQPQKEKS